MIQRAFFSAFAAILLSATLIQTAAAATYPITARSGTTTVYGAYRPLDLDLTTLSSGTFNYNGTNLLFDGIFSGTFEGDGYLVSGQAGNWEFFLSDALDDGCIIGTNTNCVTLSTAGNVITMTSSGAGLQVGEMVYLGGLDVVSGELQTGDTPQPNDIFKLFTTGAGTVLDVVIDDIGNNFDLTLRQDLEHIGPFTRTFTDFVVIDDLDEARLNELCMSGNDVVPCGRVTGLTASSVLEPSSVPEPATLALLGLGLAGLGLSRRARA